MPQQLVGLLIIICNTFQTQLPVDYRFPDVEPEHNIWSEQATSPQCCCVGLANIVLYLLRTSNDFCLFITFYKYYWRPVICK